MTKKNSRIEKEELQKSLEMYKLIFDSIYNGAIVTNISGIITDFNKPYGEFLRVNPKDQIGRHCTESVENSRMHIVAKTGIPKINESHSNYGKKHGGPG